MKILCIGNRFIELNLNGTLLEIKIFKRSNLIATLVLDKVEMKKLMSELGILYENMPG